MSEIRTPYEHAADTLSMAVQPEWQAFEALAALPSVQRFCEYDSRYSYMGRSKTQEELEQDYDLAFMKRHQRAESFSADEVAECLERTNARLDRFLDTVVEDTSLRRRKPIPEDEAERLAVLSKVFAGGLERVHDTLRRVSDNQEASYYYLQTSFLPVSLVMLGARMKAAKHYQQGATSMEAASPQTEIDDDIDKSLQEACQRIQQNEKITVPKTASETDRLFAASMNCLRTLYFSHQHRGFQRQLLTYYGGAYFEREIKTFGQRHEFDMGDPQAQITLGSLVYRRVESHFKELLGMDLPAVGDSDAARALQKAAQEGMKDSESGQMEFKKVDTEARISAIHSAHQFVDGLASGSIVYGEITKAMMKLRERPLEPTYYDKLVDLVQDEWVDWEILPKGVFEGAERHPDGDVPANPYQHETWVDWSRVLRLQNYAKGWNDAYYVRTKIPNMSLDDQYYAVVLPEVRDGQVYEHAFADHPKAKHGLYAWRAEMGIDDGRTRLTWREVMSQPRMVARQLGARCLYHTTRLENNLLDYLTTNPDTIARRHYARTMRPSK